MDIETVERLAARYYIRHRLEQECSDYVDRSLRNIDAELACRGVEQAKSVSSNVATRQMLELMFWKDLAIELSETLNA